MYDLPIRCPNIGGKRITFSVFFSGKHNELAKGTFYTKRVHQNYHAKRVHLVRMNTHPPVEILVAKRG